jgi:hypothetical protein
MAALPSLWAVRRARQRAARTREASLRADYDYLATAAHFAAESSTGAGVNMATADHFTKCADALVYYIDPENERKIAYPILLFDPNSSDGHAKMCFVLTLNMGNNQGTGDIVYGNIYDIYSPPSHLHLFDGPACNIINIRRILGHGTSAGDLVAGTTSKAKLGMHSQPVGEASYAPRQSGDIIKNDEAQGNQVFCQMNECIPEVVKAMCECMKETASEELRGDRVYPPRPLYPYTPDHRPHHDERKGDREAVTEAGKLGLHPKPVGEATYAPCQGGDFIPDAPPATGQACPCPSSFYRKPTGSIFPQ